MPKHMSAIHTFRPFVFAFSVNLLLVLWAWLGVNHGKGLFYFTTDEIGLMMLLPLAACINLLFWFVAYLRQSIEAKGFGLVVLLLLAGSIAVWVHAGITGVSA